MLQNVYRKLLEKTVARKVVIYLEGKGILPDNVLKDLRKCLGVMLEHLQMMFSKIRWRMLL